MTPQLRSYEPRFAATIVAWARPAEELDAWASLTEGRPNVFDRWHAEPGVHPYVLAVDEQPVAYGEVWEDREEDEAELARVIVAPSMRGRGLGRTLITMLAVEARRMGFVDIWVRVEPSNAAALACYGAAGFERTDADEEAAFNTGQPRVYVWMRLPPDRLG
ncbi:MAG: GNAT family N-acetyltransferase [Actinomycetota bacterium]